MDFKTGGSNLNTSELLHLTRSKDIFTLTLNISKTSKLSR